jgi:hypothetical protein
MGLCRQDLALLTKLKFLVEEKSVITLGNPFFERSTLRKLVPEDIVDECFKLEKIDRAAWLFMRFLGAREFLILDISQEEGAGIIYDMNAEELPSDCMGRFDLVIDCGTQEHVFDNKNFLRNVFKMLRVEGYYYFNVPASGMLEHGFRQYSPTFFYDLCQKNKQMIKLAYLSLFYPPSSNGVNLFDLYEKLDPLNYQATVSPLDAKGLKNDRYGLLTGLMIRLHNIEPRPSSLLGLIKKNREDELSFLITQCLYRTYSLKSMTRDHPKTPETILRTLVRGALITLVLKLPLPTSLKGILLHQMTKFIFMMRKK